VKWKEFGMRCESDEENCTTSEKEMAMEMDSVLENNGAMKLKIFM
jgi:hypothetical protein